MNITPEMMVEDEKRWYARDVITELGYCGNYMRDRKDMTNLDIRFYAYIMRKACDMLKAQMPRVMTVEEAKEYLSGCDEERIPLYVEFYFKCPLWIKWTNENLMQNIKGITAWEFNDYNTQCEFGWRVWTIKPSPEQMRETPWEGGEEDA